MMLASSSSPPKPWERSSAVSAIVQSAAQCPNGVCPLPSSISASSSSINPSSSSAAAAVAAASKAITDNNNNNTVNRMNSTTTLANNNSPFLGGAGTSSLYGGGSMYGRYGGGGYGSMGYGGGYGGMGMGYGGGYSSMGMGYGGYGGMYGGGMGLGAGRYGPMNGVDPNNPQGPTAGLQYVMQLMVRTVQLLDMNFESVHFFLDSIARLVERIAFSKLEVSDMFRVAAVAKSGEWVASQKLQDGKRLLWLVIALFALFKLFQKTTGTAAAAAASSSSSSTATAVATAATSMMNGTSGDIKMNKNRNGKVMGTLSWVAAGLVFLGIGKLMFSNRGSKSNLNRNPNNSITTSELSTAPMLHNAWNA